KYRPDGQLLTRLRPAELRDRQSRRSRHLCQNLMRTFMPRTPLSTVFKAGLILSFASFNMAAADDREIASFVAFGDSGYIPAYDDPDEDEIFLTPEALIADEQKSWLKKHKDLSGFTPPPIVFEASQGSY